METSPIFFLHLNIWDLHSSLVNPVWPVIISNAFKPHSTPKMVRLGLVRKFVINFVTSFLFFGSGITNIARILPSVRFNPVIFISWSKNFYFDFPELRLSKFNVTLFFRAISNTFLILSTCSSFLLLHTMISSMYTLTPVDLK